MKTNYAVLFGCLVIMAFCLENASAQKSHVPEFTWKVHGGVVNPEQWIYDGDIPIARFEQLLVEQPEQGLRYFNSIPKPPLLRSLRLTPDGIPLLEGVQLYWVLQWHAVITDNLIDLQVNGNGTERLEVTFNTQDKGKIATSRRILTLTYDSEIGSYVYDFQCILELHAPDMFRDKAVTFEFCDPWYTDCPGPAVEFQGMWEKRYQRIAWEAQDGTVQCIPLNHYATSMKTNIWLKPNGLFVPLDESDGNPAFQFDDETSRNSDIDVCMWGYDVHFSREVAPEELDSPIITRFRIFQCPGERARELNRIAVLRQPKPDEFGGKNEFPIYERKSSFAKGMGLGEVWNGALDPYQWSVAGDGAEWDKVSGRTDRFSLKIEKTKSGVTRWKTYEGQGFWMDPWTARKGYRVRCWAKTDEVSGIGSAIALQYIIPNDPQRYPVVASKKLSGMNEWTLLESEIGVPPSDTGCLLIMLQQDGSGTTWFDDFEVIPIN